ncbi:MAG TPA: selenocysteine-specific translation elongation factor [Candidatus Hypogeohydataceae bacterium YC40]
MKRVVIGTAGHIDHGKTALVKALTGIDTDRLPEEKARGITIDLGFAYMDLEGGWRVGIVDVPGHERFVKNMLAGATGIDIALLVIAADDGVMPQTVEHLEILELLGLKQGVVVVTKKDLVEREWLGLVKEDIKELTKGTFLEGAPLVEVASPKGEGIAELKGVIRELLENAKEEAVQGLFRLPIDRAFTIQGFGCVITGTVLSGQVKVGEEVELLPVKEVLRVRGIEVHGEKVECAVRGQRAALNLGGVKTSEVRRGFGLSIPGYLDPTELVDCHLHHLSSSRRPIQNGERVRFHIATTEVMGRVVLLDREVLRAGEECFVQFRLEGPVVAERGDHYVIRSYSPCRTIGGGKVLRCCTSRLRRFKEDAIKELQLLLVGDEKEVIEQALLKSKDYLLSSEELVKSLNIYPSRVKEVIDELTAKGTLAVIKEDSKVLFAHKQRLESLKIEILKKLEDFHTDNPMRLGLEESLLRLQLPGQVSPPLFSLVISELSKEGFVTVTDHKISTVGFQVRLSQEEKKIMEEIEEAFLRDKFSPPGLETLVPQEPPLRQKHQNLLSLLLEQKTLIKVEEGLYFHAKAVEELKGVVASFVKERGSITVADLRDIVNTSRKYAVPLLEYFDKIHFTRREGDKRVLHNLNA